METITYESLRIKAPFVMETIYGFTYHSSRGKHVIAEITGIVSREDVLLGLRESAEGKLIQVYAEGKEREITTIYYGIIQRVEITEEGGMCIAHITAASTTSVMDSSRKKRSFQNINDTYADVIKKIVSQYDGASLIWHGKDRAIERPFIQYEETDWEFIRRIASNLGVLITAECRTKAPVFHVGHMKEQRAVKETSGTYTVRFNPGYYKRTMETKPADRRKYIVYEVQDRMDYRLGDRLSVAGKSLTVCLKNAELKDGILVFAYSLSNETFSETEPQFNEKIHGAVLYGSVLDTAKEKVKICLEIDGVQDINTAYSFNWRPMTGNLLYCMPEKGERIALYIQDSDEKNALAAYGMRRNGMLCAELADANNRFFTTAENKRFYMHPEASGLEVIEGYSKPLVMKMEDTSGVSVKAAKDISIMAEKQMTLKGKSVVIQTPKEASLVRKDLLSPTVINLCNAFDAIGASGNFASNLVEYVPDKGIPSGKNGMEQKPGEDTALTITHKEYEKPYGLEEAIIPIMESIPVEEGLDEMEAKIIGSMPLI